MADFKFSCPFCDRHLQAEDSWAGIVTQCPDCGNNITIPPPESAVLTPYTNANTAPQAPEAPPPRTYPVPGIKHDMPPAEVSADNRTAPMPPQTEFEKVEVKLLPVQAPPPLVAVAVAVAQPVQITPPPAVPEVEVKPQPATPAVQEPSTAQITPPASQAKEVPPRTQSEAEHFIFEEEDQSDTVQTEQPVAFTPPESGSIAEAPQRPGAGTFVVSLGVFLLGLAIYAINMLPLIRESAAAKWKMREVLSSYAKTGNVNTLDHLINFEELSLRNGYICWGSLLLITFIVWLLTVIAIRKKFMGWPLAMLGLLIAMLGSTLTDFIIRILHAGF